jgi:hypothetical protein
MEPKHDQRSGPDEAWDGLASADFGSQIAKRKRILFSRIDSNCRASILAPARAFVIENFSPRF